jgi:hypothetical protein
MSDHVNRRTAARLLSDPATAGPETRRLGALLAAVAAPARPGESRGEAEALAAFRSARLDPVAEPRRPSMLKTAAAKLLTVKIGLICAASLGVGGVAYAASADALPGPLHLGAGSSTSGHRPHPSGTPSVRPSHPASAPPAGLTALCHDYAGRDQDHRRLALDDPRFHDLVGRAGAKDRGRVDAYCAKLDHDWPSARPSAPASGQWPSGRPGDHPSGRPGPGTGPSDFPHPSGAPRK